MLTFLFLSFYYRTTIILVASVFIRGTRNCKFLFSVNVMKGKLGVTKTLLLKFFSSCCNKLQVLIGVPKRDPKNYSFHHKKTQETVGGLIYTHSSTQNKNKIHSLLVSLS